MSTKRNKKVYLAPAIEQINVSYPLNEEEIHRRVQTVNLNFNIYNSHEALIEPQTSLLDPKDPVLQQMII